MQATPRFLSYGSRQIPYGLRIAPRKRLRIVVRPDLTVRVEAPNVATEAEIQKAIRAKAPWIARQLDAMDAFQPLPTPHRYVSGETLVYLGRQYRLRVEVGEKAPAKLRGRFLHVTVPDRQDRDAIRRAVDAWYREHAGAVFGRSLEGCLKIAARHGVEAPALAIRAMRARWGSCSPSGRITLNLHLIQAPAHCIEYVVMHELCHVAHHNHSPAFYRLLTRCMSDWEKRRTVLRRIAINNPSGKSG